MEWPGSQVAVTLYGGVRLTWALIPGQLLTDRVDPGKLFNFSEHEFCKYL